MGIDNYFLRKYEFKTFITSTEYGAHFPIKMKKEKTTINS